VLLAGEKADDPARKAIVHVKSSLAPKGASIAYILHDGGFEWAGRSNLTVDDLLRPAIPPEERSALDEAGEFLLRLLADGAAVPVRDVLKQAADAGIGVRTLRRARRLLGVRSERNGVAGQGRGGAEYVLSLPAQDAGKIGG
jgi:hypothetical protein